MVLSNGLYLDDNGFAVSIVSQPLQAGDAFNGGLVKQGSGTIYIDSGSLYTGTTVVTNGTLAGFGSINGPVVVGPAGAIGAGEAGGPGTFSINNNLTIQGKAALRISKNGGAPISDLVACSGTVNYGGTLVVTNITSDATPLVAGDVFTLFSAVTHNGTFAGILGSPGPGLSYSFANGVLTVVNGPSSTPINVIFSVSGSTLTLSWPADHLGWIAQSNSVSVANSGAWFDIPGSQSSTSLNIAIDWTRPPVFFRLRFP